MVTSRNWRRILPLLLSFACYGVVWITFSEADARVTSHNHGDQAAFTIGALAVLSLPGFLMGRAAASVALVLKALGLFFLALAQGPQVFNLGLAVVPAVLVATLRFPPLAALGLCVLPMAALLPVLFPHQVWEGSAPAASIAQVCTLAALFSTVFVLGSLLRKAETEVHRQSEAIGRLDFAFQNVAQANLELQTYAIYAKEEAMESERHRVAGEIHDIIGYTLTNLMILIQTSLALSRPGGKVHTILESAASQATDGLADARRALAHLRGQERNQPRGANLFLQVAKRFSDATGVKVRIHFPNLPQELPLGVEHALFRIIQEGLTNSFRHGKAHSVDVNFWYDGTLITLNLMDNGVGGGYPARDSDLGTGIGLSGLRELVNGLGGTFHSGPVEGGYALRATVPLAGGLHE